MAARTGLNSGAGFVQTASRAAFTLSGSGRHVSAVPNRQRLLDQENRHLRARLRAS